MARNFKVIIEVTMSEKTLGESLYKDISKMSIEEIKVFAREELNEALDDLEFRIVDIREE